MRMVVSALAIKVGREPSACDDPDAGMIDDHIMRGAHDDEGPA